MLLFVGESRCNLFFVAPATSINVDLSTFDAQKNNTNLLKCQQQSAIHAYINLPDEICSRIAGAFRLHVASPRKYDWSLVAKRRVLPVRGLPARTVLNAVGYRNSECSYCLQLFPATRTELNAAAPRLGTWETKSFIVPNNSF